MKRALKIVAVVLASATVLLALAVILIASFDWNRAKPWLDEKVEAASGRRFAINGDLSLSWQPPPHATGWQRLVPWPHLRAKDVVLGNPDWATTGPDMARVRQVDISFNPLALLHHTVAIRSLVLTDPHLVLERGKGERANWHLGKQQQQAPSRWKFDLHNLGLEQGKVRYVDPAKKADFTTDIDTLPDGGVKWRSDGRFNKEALSGHGRAGAILSLQASDVRYPVQGEVQIGQTTVTIDGTLTNPLHASALDVKLKLLGASMADLFSFSGVLLPETPKFSTEGRLSGNLKPGAIHLRYQDFKGKVGSSDLAGTLEYKQQQPRSRLSGKVVSHYLDLSDLRALIGAGGGNRKSNASVKQPPGKVLPVAPFRTDRWKGMDADVEFNGEKIVQSKRLPLDHLYTRIEMNNSVLSLKPLNFGVAGGKVETRIRINGRQDPPAAQLKISARGLRLSKMFPDVRQMRASTGQLHGDGELSGTGESIAKLLGSADGHVEALVTSGSVSKLILEAMGLNIGAVVAAKIFGDKQVQLNCMVADFEVDNGLMKARTFVVDTSDALINIGGNINLASEKLGLAIHTKTKGVRLLSLRSPLHVAGTFKNPDIGIDKGAVAARAGAAAALGILAAPVAALLALAQPGPGESNPCQELVGHADTR